MSVALEDVHKEYRAHTGSVIALERIDLAAADGELLVVVGPSGSGKTTLLRCIAGLEQPDRGRVSIGGTDVTDDPPAARDVAMVFQEHALYPHLSVEDNITFGLRARKEPEPSIAQKLVNVSELMGIEKALSRKPAELSGGERQRVALARAIVREPKAFLMDEPLSDLDAELRAYMRAEIHALQRRLATTTVYVTHDQIEAMTLGDKVAVVRDGRIEQAAAPADLYDRPANTFVARFIGSPPMNVVPAAALGISREGFLGIRPERIRLGPAGSARESGRVTRVEMIGHESIAHVIVNDEVLLARVPRENAPAAHSDTGIDFLDDDLHHFEADGKAIR